MNVMLFFISIFIFQADRILRLKEIGLPRHSCQVYTLNLPDF